MSTLLRLALPDVATRLFLASCFQFSLCCALNTLHAVSWRSSLCTVHVNRITKYHEAKQFTTAMYAPAGMLPPCGHACQATVLVDEGLQQPQIDVCSAFPAANACSIHGKQHEPAESLQCVLAQPSQSPEQPGLPENSASQLQSQSPAGLQHHSVLGQSQKGMTVVGLQDECQHPGAQADAAAALLYCGAGLPNAYLAIMFDQLLLLSMGWSVDLVQDSASSAGSCCIIIREQSAMAM